MDFDRRRLIAATATVGGVAGVAATVPFLTRIAPSDGVSSAGAPVVEVDLAKLAPGQMMTVDWRGKPVWILHRTPEMLDGIAKADDKVADPLSKRPNQPEYARNRFRSRKPEYLVAVGICPHQGCLPTEKFKPGADSGIDPDWPGGFLCPCHGSTFDLAGRVFKNKPAPDNLQVPPHMFVGETTLVIGDDRTRT